MTNRIDRKLEQLKSAQKKMLSPYITAGDPAPGETVKIMHQLVADGADVLEIGIPFSDPMAEGPVIQEAMERALLHDVSCDDVLNMISEFRQKDTDTPIVIMGYLNPIEQYGYERFAQMAIEAGVDGTILVDLPPEESDSVASIWDNHGLYLIYLCSPTTSDERMSLINKVGKGYLYYVTLKGVTGSDALDLNSVESQYKLRKTRTNLPLMVGFGIKTPEMAADVSQFADGVIVGAALITELHQAYISHQDVSKGTALIHNMRAAMDNQ